MNRSYRSKLRKQVREGMDFETQLSKASRSAAKLDKVLAKRLKLTGLKAVKYNYNVCRAIGQAKAHVEILEKLFKEQLVDYAYEEHLRKLNKQVK